MEVWIHWRRQKQPLSALHVLEGETERGETEICYLCSQKGTDTSCLVRNIWRHGDQIAGPSMFQTKPALFMHQPEASLENGLLVDFLVVRWRKAMSKLDCQVLSWVTLSLCCQSLTKAAPTSHVNRWNRSNSFSHLKTLLNPVLPSFLSSQKLYSSSKALLKANVAELCKSLLFKHFSLVIVRFQRYDFKSILEMYFLKGIVITVAQGEYKLCSSESKDSDFKCHCWFNTFQSIILFLIDTKWQKNWRLPWMGHTTWDKTCCKWESSYENFCTEVDPISHSWNARNF